ncbi:MAG: GntR family transcriptional regulator [Blastococcus sp.]
MTGTDHPVDRLDRASAAPLWRQLLTDLRARLARGEFASGFPGELDLVDQYGVSRHTVREALRQLRDEGTISTGRGRRPRLAAAEPVIAAPTGVAYSLFAAVESGGLPQISVVRALDVRADGVVAARLGLEESTPLVYLERLRLAGGAPLALDRVWLPASIGEPLLTADFRRTGLYDQLAATGIRITGGEETVRAVVPSRAEHDVLGLTPPAAAFSVFRTGTSSGVPVEWRHTLVRADRFALTGALSAPAPGEHPATGDVAPVALTPDIR